jgi:hypothetical protein
MIPKTIFINLLLIVGFFTTRIFFLPPPLKTPATKVKFNTNKPPYSFTKEELRYLHKIIMHSENKFNFVHKFPTKTPYRNLNLMFITLNSTQLSASWMQSFVWIVDKYPHLLLQEDHGC